MTVHIVERWAQGTPLADYIQASAARRQVLRRLAEITLPEEVRAFFQNLTAPIYGLVITEDWCPLTPEVLAVLMHCSELSQGRLQVRVFKRDANPDLMELYLREGKYRSIPVVAFFDERFQPLGDIREKPELPEWSDLEWHQRLLARMRMGWSELWGRACMAIIAQGLSTGEDEQPDEDHRDLELSKGRQ